MSPRLAGIMTHVSTVPACVRIIPVVRQARAHHGPVRTVVPVCPAWDASATPNSPVTVVKHRSLIRIRIVPVYMKALVYRW